MMRLNRRTLLTSLAATTAAATLGRPLQAASPAMAGTKLRVQYREIAVKGKSKKVFGIQQPNGAHGIILGSRDRFRVELTNAVNDPLVIHWHGQEPPVAQDGVPELTQYPIPPRTMQYYDFEARPGTHWMHSHLGFQEQDMMAAPLIVRTADEERADLQEVVIMLHDFSFQEPEAILADLGGLSGEDGHAHSHSGPAMPPATTGGAMAGMPGMGNMANMAGMPMPPGTPAMPGMQSMQGMHNSVNVPQPEIHTGHGMAGAAVGEMKMDLNDINFDAYLANDRTLDDPEIVRVEAGGRVRLRIINAAAATNFSIDLGELTGRVVAVDGNPIQPFAASRLPLSIAQRLDIVLDLPRSQGSWPVLAQREGEKDLTGIVLATARGTVRKLDSLAMMAAGPLTDHEFESKIVPLAPLPVRPPDRNVVVKLTGGMSPYAWSMSASPSGENLPIEVGYGERVRFAMHNETMMPHPMHLHGHHFQVTSFMKDGKRKEFRGAIRDTVLVPPAEVVTIEFDAINPGRWAFHCHMLYHQATGMMSEVRYVA